jgi:hypothetical protein
MRLIISTIIALVVSFVFFIIIKLWGASQAYIAYSHPLFENATTPITFKIATPATLKNDLESANQIYLNVAVTQDQKLMIVDPQYEALKRQSMKMPYRYNSKTYEDQISSDSQSPLLVENYKDQLKNKKIIFNMQDNPLQSTPVFIKTMADIGLEDGHNFIFISAYDPPAKDLKTLKPTYLFGSTDPEILKIKALESMYLVEVANYRADIVVHPMTYYKQPFYTETLLANLKHRHKKFIIGPLQDGEMAAAMALNPFGVIIK